MQPSEGTSPLRAAFEADEHELARELIARGVDPNAPDPSSDELPLQLALSARMFDLAEELLARGADPTRENEYSAPLLGAVSSGSVAWVERLLAAGADRDRKDHNGLGLLAYAAANVREIEMLRALFRLGLGAGRAQAEALWAAAVSRDDAATISTLLELGGVPPQGDLLAALGAAVVNGHVEVARVLLPHLEDKDACTDPTWSAGGARGRSPNTLLGIAIFESKLAMVELLLEAGADPGAALPVDARERSEVIPKGTTAVGMAELRKKQLAKAREAHLYPDHEKILALLRAHGGPKPTRAAKPSQGARAKGASGPAHKRAIDAALLRLAREGGGDEQALQEALDALPTTGGPWDHLQRVLAKARDPLFEGDLPSRLERTLLGRLLSDDPFDGDEPPEVLAKPKRGGKGPTGNVIYLEYYPKEAKKPLREGEIVAASGADVWIVEPLDGGDARFSHAHPEGFSVLAEGAVAFVERQVDKALTKR
jgi:ankyrin repeat protein